MFDFFVHEVPNEGLCYGCSPESLTDVRAIKNYQCTAVLNLMTKEEMEMRQIAPDYEQLMCKQTNLNYVPFPIAHGSTDKMTDKLFQACLILNDMINNKGERVFVHCMSGTTRSPTLILLFLCLYRL